MPEISMRRKHGFTDPDDLKSRIEGLADRVSERLGGQWHWQGEEAICEAGGARACVGYDDEEIRIDVTLPLMLRPLRSKLEAKIDEYYARFFASS
jgi:putative polyhydroxyalkanoate system protein